MQERDRELQPFSVFDLGAVVDVGDLVSVNFSQHVIRFAIKSASLISLYPAAESSFRIADAVLDSQL